MDIALKIQYDGTNYSGWQVQPNSITVQELVDKALCKVFNIKLTSMGSGRTDAGVHARAQVCSVKFDGTPNIEPAKLIKALNNKLPFDIRIVKANYFQNFHARFDALYREYSYTIIIKEDVFNDRFATFIKYPINLDLLWDAALIFKQKVDFTTFSKLNPDKINPICDVVTSRWEILEGHRFRYHIRANHFLYGMVRSLVGTMIDIARGRRSLSEVELALSLKDRKLNSPLISPKGLILEKICYPEDIDF